MKHAVLIIAHCNLEHILNEIKKYDDDFSFFIHWDKRTPLTEEQKEKLSAEKKILYFDEKYIVNWGGYGIVRATFLLCKQALKSQVFDYYHLISGTDVLVRNVHDFKKFFAENAGKNFLQHFMVQKTSEELDKMRYFHRLEKYNIHFSNDDNLAYVTDIEQQKKNGVKRGLPNCDILWGSAWWSLQRPCVEYLVSQENFVEKYFLDTLIADEHFAQTVIMNSCFAETVVNDNLRYISWIYKNGNRPAVLDRNDLGPIVNNQFFFARKVNLEISGELLDALDKTIFQPYIQVDKTELNLTQIIHSVLNDSDKSRLGLMYGNGGALVFICQCLKLAIAPELITEKVIEELQRKIIGEFESLDDNSYILGKLGLLTAFEYSKNLSIDTGVEATENMEDMKSSIINQVLNGEGKKKDSEISGIYKFFRTLYVGNRLDAISRIAWLKIQDQCDLNTHKTGFKVCIHNKGLRGLAGLGLWKLTKEYNLNIEEWGYLLSEMSV